MNFVYPDLNGVQFMPEEHQERVYQVNNTERVQRQFLVQDPDGYLLRQVQVINH